MQLFIAALDEREVDAHALEGALRRAAARVPHMDLDGMLVRRSRSGRLALAAVAHPDRLAAPRRYRAVAGEEVVLFDGLPVAPHAPFVPHDAEALRASWDRLGELLEGQFSALRADLAEDRVEALSDPLGLAPLYVARAGGLALVANTVAAMAAFGGLSAPDPLGVSTFLAFGWASGHRTLLEGVRAVPGGTRLSLTARDERETAHFGPARAIASARRPPVAPGAFVEEMVALTRAAVDDGVRPVRCAITAGRDTRAILALLRATPAARDADYGTVGDETEDDVRVARLVARELGLAHRVIPPDPAPVANDPVELIATFMALTDGLSSLLQIADVGDLADPLHALGLQLSGIGGEFARPGAGLVKNIAPNAPLLRGSRRFQTRVLAAKTRAGGILAPSAVATTHAYLGAFVDARLAEGWRTRELAEAFFVYERVGRWGSTAVRRASARDDFFSPFCSRPFLEYALSLPPQERFIESAHYRILSLEPRLRDLPFPTPWKPRRPGLAPLLLASAAARMAVGRLGIRDRLPRRSPSRAAAAAEPASFGIRWLDAHRALHREHCLSFPDSPLWTWMDRGAVERGLAGPIGDDAAGAGLLRAVSLLWYFHGAGGPALA